MKFTQEFKTQLTMFTAFAFCLIGIIFFFIGISKNIEPLFYVFPALLLVLGISLIIVGCKKKIKSQNIFFKEIIDGRKVKIFLAYLLCLIGVVLILFGAFEEKRFLIADVLLGITLLLVGIIVTLGYRKAIKADNGLKEIAITVESMKGTDLQGKDGIKIRRIYLQEILNLIILMLVGGSIYLFGLILNDYFLGSEIDVTVAFGCCGGFFIVGVPLYVICVLNRYFFGRILCMISNEGISLKNNFFPWYKIKKINYMPDLLGGKHRIAKSLACIYVEGEEFPFAIEYFPFYGFRKIKEISPQTEVNLDVASPIQIIICVVVTLVVLLCIKIFL